MHGLYSANHDEELQYLLLSNTRIISTAHKSIATLLHNHIALDPLLTAFPSCLPFSMFPPEYFSGFAGKWQQ
jgi:hypothetical protein